MKILFITATYLGDGILTTGALDHLTKVYPEADITVACGPVVAGIFAACPNVKKVIAMKKEPYAGHWLKLAQATFAEKWDIIVDLRNSLLSRVLRADKKYIFGKRDSKKHKVEQVAEAMGGITPPPAPRLWFDAATLEKADKIAPNGAPILAIGPAANWAGKEWGAENYINLVRKLVADDGILPGARLAVLAAPGEELRAWPVLNAVPKERQIDVIAKGPPLLSAAILRKAALYIGNDSGLTHAAAAAGAPTLALFGYGWPDIYRPWGDNCDYITTPETPEQLIKGHASPREVKTSLMGSLTVSAAHEAAVKLWNKVNH